MNTINVYTGKVRRGQGKTKNLDLQHVPEGLRIMIRFRTTGEAENHQGFISRVGTIVKSIVPISYFDEWKVPPKLK